MASMQVLTAYFVDTIPKILSMKTKKQRKFYFLTSFAVDELKII
ncbi:MAG: hypothetical protein RLZZ203_1895 [Cyanobacteriota bacterium]|jgi:hypothetical protein